ncbi:hypothetical protein [Arsenicibacter rosenii]|uniref:Uncharacterized protein n=1 Tax=Arsenicibacter rosenii TaxID=1750698 RepID=A0A1S2VFA2_9BACT|nr:hypothetical protein [Arsenicibacter rosenii]OIN57389.1 hypothetical protein BLX24_20595 [Arsenicibacter rosenii]
MNWQRDKKRIITYSPDKLQAFEVIMYEWIDNLNFTIDPKECIDNAGEYIAVVKGTFLEAGWDGDGEVELMWIPPFMFKGMRTPEFTMGVTIWHVKQRDDGLSWLLTPIELPCQSEF